MGLFKLFREVCKYRKLGYEFHGSSECKFTCRHKDNIAKGSSWGKCNYKNCPTIARIVIVEMRKKINTKLVRKYCLDCKIYKNEVYGLKLVGCRKCKCMIRNCPILSIKK